MTYRVLVTGSRTWPTASPIRLPLALLLQAHGSLTVVHGGASKGADHFADEWATWQARVARPVRVELHPADWNRHGRRAGYIRNAEMVSLGADECLAFVMPCDLLTCRQPKPHGSHGATDCADRARAAGIPVSIHEWPTT